MAGKTTLIFDLDGTLIDSLEDIAICMNKVLEEMNIPIHKIDDYKYFVGGGISVLIDNALKGYDEKIKKEATEKFKVIYDQKLHSNTKPYDGIYELLDELEKLDLHLAILSNKPHEFTVAYTNSLFKKYNFKEIHGQKEDVPKKPNPIAANNIIKSLDTTCEKTYFIGDTKVDMQTAKNGNMTAIGVLWGFRDKKELEDNGADFLVNHPLEILKIVQDEIYKPISCNLYDLLESYAVKKIYCEIVYLQNDKEVTIKDFIVNFKTLNKEEFLILSNKKEIRLDKILKVNKIDK